jgi:protein-tyrosine-phosphatase
MLRPYGHGDGAVDVADPYYGDEAGFDTCVAIVERSIDGLLAALANEVTSA